MNIILNILYIVLGSAGLYYGAEFLVKGGVALARKAGVSPLVIGLTLVAFATSAPELVVSVSAALSGNVDISLGNVMGSNICNIALILGLSACIRPLPVQKQLLKFDAPVMIGATLLLTLFYFLNQGVNRWQGALFFLLLLAYVAYNVYMAKKEGSSEIPEEVAEAEKGGKLLPVWAALLLVIAGLALLVGGADLFLRGAKFIAKLFKLSDAVIGLTIVAVGTSLPELATSLVAAAKGETDIAIGNVIGSNIFNILCILGIAPMICPMTGTRLDLADLGAMLFCAIILLPMMRIKWKITRPEGAFLVLFYIGYISYLLMKTV